MAINKVCQAVPVFPVVIDYRGLDVVDLLACTENSIREATECNRYFPAVVTNELRQGHSSDILVVFVSLFFSTL